MTILYSNFAFQYSCTFVWPHMFQNRFTCILQVRTNKSNIEIEQCSRVSVTLKLSMKEAFLAFEYLACMWSDLERSEVIWTPRYIYTCIHYTVSKKLLPSCRRG